MSSSKHYCSCNPKSKPASQREEAKWYCFRHRRFLCDNCIYDELNQRHVSCVVGTYDEFIKSPAGSYAKFKKNMCTMCDKQLPDDDPRAVVRLNCACVYHTTCLQQYLLSHESNNIPCLKCKTLIIKKCKKPSNLSQSVENFLRSVSRQRLWKKPKKITENKQSGDIILDTRDMTRHRTVTAARVSAVSVVQSSMNRDGNLEDDKYHKPVHIQSKKRNKIKGLKHKKDGKKSWFNMRKTLVVLLLCFALIAQCWFLYMVFIKKNVEVGDDVNKNKVKMNGNVNMNRVGGVMDNLRPKLKQQILGNKLKYREMQKRLID